MQHEFHHRPLQVGLQLSRMAKASLGPTTLDVFPAVPAETIAYAAAQSSRRKAWQPGSMSCGDTPRAKSCASTRGSPGTARREGIHAPRTPFVKRRVATATQHDLFGPTAPRCRAPWRRIAGPRNMRQLPPSALAIHAPAVATPFHTLDCCGAERGELCSCVCKRYVEGGGLAGEAMCRQTGKAYMLYLRLRVMVPSPEDFTQDTRCSTLPFWGLGRLGSATNPGSKVTPMKDTVRAMKSGCLDSIGRAEEAPQLGERGKEAAQHTPEFIREGRQMEGLASDNRAEDTLKGNRPQTARCRTPLPNVPVNAKAAHSTACHPDDGDILRVHILHQDDYRPKAADTTGGPEKEGLRHHVFS